MKRTMLVMLAAMALCACSKEGTTLTGNSSSSTIKINMASFVDSDQTKTSMTSKGDITWSEGDAISVWPTNPDEGQTSTQLKFNINSGENSSSAVFEGTGWGLITDGTRQYVAYYPYVENGSLNHVDVEYTDNLSNPVTSQSLNPPTNISINDFMCSEKITPSSPEAAEFNFRHLGALAKFRVKLPEETRMYFVTIKAPEPVFVKKGYYDPTSENPSIIATEYTDRISYILRRESSIKVINEYAYFIMAPAALNGLTLEVFVGNRKGNYLYKGTYTCTQNQEAGKMYNYSVVCSKYTMEEPAEPEFVDLGTNDGILWCTTSLGAEEPWNAGALYAWGETEPKTSFSWSNYKWGSSASTATKYNMTDGKRTLDYEDDAAYVNWNGAVTGCRMPTNKEFERMVSMCTHKTGYVNGVQVVWYTNNGNSICLPVNQQVATSYLSDLSAGQIYAGNYSDGYHHNSGTRYRYQGFSIRPVKPANQSIEE